MVTLDPQSGDSRRSKEALIRLIDLAVYAAVIAGGVLALAFPPETVQSKLGGYEWLAIFWGVLLLVAGAMGLLGRLSRYWIIEMPGTVASVFGALIYLVVLSASAMSSASNRVAVAMTVVATLCLVRRYVELQLFTTDPGVSTLSVRISKGLRRRTANTIASK